MKEGLVESVARVNQENFCLGSRSIYQVGLFIETYGTLYLLRIVLNNFLLDVLVQNICYALIAFIIDKSLSSKSIIHRVYSIQ